MLLIISFNFFLPIPYGDSGSPAKSSSLVGKMFGSPNIVPPEEVKTNLLQSVVNKVFISWTGCKILCSKSSNGSPTETTTEDWAAK